MTNQIHVQFFGKILSLESKNNDISKKLLLKKPKEIKQNVYLQVYTYRKQAVLLDDLDQCLKCR